MPLSILPGETTKFTVRGANLETVTEVRVHEPKSRGKIITKGKKVGVPNNFPAERIGDSEMEIEIVAAKEIGGATLSFSVIGPGGESNVAKVAVDDAAHRVLEKEPNDGFDKAQLIDCPVTVEGTIDRVQDSDVYQFRGKAGETIRIENFDLWYAPRHRDIPMYLSAVFAKGIALCGEVADGIILTRSTLRTAAPVRAQLAAAARRAGRDAGKIEITTLLQTSVNDSRDAALTALRPGLAFYLGFFPRYNKMMAEHGFAAEAAAIAEAWARGDREAAERAVSDAMIAETSIVGTPEQCRARLAGCRVAELPGCRAAELPG